MFGPTRPAAAAALAPASALASVAPGTMQASPRPRACRATGSGRARSRRRRSPSSIRTTTRSAVRISGAQLREYLEYSSRYYRQSPTGAPVVDSSVAGYDFDAVSGVDYALDLARPVGERVVALTFRGRAVAPGDSFTLALNNYRQTGGDGYAMLRGAPVVYDRQQDIGQLLIDELRRRHTIRQSDYFVKNWSILPPRSTR